MTGNRDDHTESAAARFLRLGTPASEDTRARLGEDENRVTPYARPAQTSGAGALRNLSTQNDTGSRHTPNGELPDAATRCEAKLYKHARTTRNLTATPDMQKHAVEASRLFFWDLFR